MTVEEAIERAALIAGTIAVAYDQLKEAHYLHSPKMFDPKLYGVDMEVVKWSRDAADRIRALSLPQSKP